MGPRDCAGIVSGALIVVFRNNLADFWITCLVGMVGWAVLYFLNIYVQIRFLSEFLAAAALRLWQFYPFSSAWESRLMIL
ncbi:hypothetical protein JCM14108_2599 [Lentilactobacillus farraginis DSM 18382 = JCM 14108]|uniref:Threonine/serine exporter-like N-terminal domain-containing protein n=1 Tax=Lentilactobacillus farraginis DSM 18382 = JCM 14108 TaxID=1423743 RepID=X0PJX4_9LACO|nr:hypothetical protein JCM14108_2599 [Lentilactobacillus farraginis DSM 18382 = JCM 14108]